MKSLLSFFLFLSIITPAFAQDHVLLQDKVTIEKAKVIEIVNREKQNLPGTDIKIDFEQIKADIIEGEEKGKEITINDDRIPLKVGDIFYVLHTIRAEDGVNIYAVQDAYRLPALAIFVGLFILLVIIFGGVQGIRGLVSLAGSFFLILFVLMPGIIHGASPIFMSIGVASLIIIAGSYITHGFNKTTTSAVIGMIITIIFTGILAYIAVHYGKLTGFESDEAVYLNVDTRGTIDFVGLLLGGMLIGLLGVLYDVAISQAITVEELHNIAPHVDRWKIYRRAIRVGREHIGALVNTLAIAYVGVSLPLLLLFYNDTSVSIMTVVNREIFASQIIRTMIGSIGLVLAVPLTTLFAIFILIPKTPHNTNEKSETEDLERYHHHH